MNFGKVSCMQSVNRMFTLILYGSLSLVVWISCASPKEVVKPAEPKSAVSVEEISIDPLQLLGDDITISPPTWEVRSVPIDTAIPEALLNVEIDTTIHEEDLEVMGYRIQLFSTDDFVSATAAHEQAMLEFSETGVYLAYDAPYYRIRIGDFQNRIDAESFLNRVVRMGYSDAYSVPSRVFSNPELRRTITGIDSSFLPVDSLNEAVLLPR